MLQATIFLVRLILVIFFLGGFGSV